MEKLIVFLISGSAFFYVGRHFWRNIQGKRNCACENSRGKCAGCVAYDHKKE